MVAWCAISASVRAPIPESSSLVGEVEGVGEDAVRGLDLSPFDVEVPSDVVVYGRVDERRVDLVRAVVFEAVHGAQSVRPGVRTRFCAPPCRLRSSDLRSSSASLFFRTIKDRLDGCIVSG